MICFDPGRQTGWAKFSGDHMYTCGLIEVLPGCSVGWPIDQERFSIIERPQIYSRMKGDPNDLITVAVIAGQIAQASQNVCFVLPREWKGTLDGDIMHVRIVEALTPTERQIYFTGTDGLADGVKHNVADAIGIGLWKLGRLSARNLTARRVRRGK